jgi:hypothetical protein
MPPDDLALDADRMLAAFDFAANELDRERRHRAELQQLVDALVGIVDSVDALREHCAQLAARSRRSAAAVGRSVAETGDAGAGRAAASRSLLWDNRWICSGTAVSVRRDGARRMSCWKSRCGVTAGGQVLRPAQVVIAATGQNTHESSLPTGKQP